MKVLWLRPDKPENISVGRHRIAKELEHRGHEVDVWNATIDDFWRVLRTSPDIVIGTTRLGAFVGAWKKLLSGTPFVVDHIDPIEQLTRTHNSGVVRIVDRLEQAAFRIADHVVFVYDEEHSRVSRHATAVTKVPLGVDFQLFSDPLNETVESARQRVEEHVDSSSNVLVYIGGLEPPYHVPTIVESLDRLDGWEFLVLGDGSQRDWIQTQSDQRDDLHYFGTVSYEEVPGYLHVADVGISLLDDPNTLKVLEYSAAGLPVVHVEGQAESRFGELVEYCSLDGPSLVDAINRAHGSEVDEATEMASRSDWETIADTYESILRTVVD